MAGLKSVAWYVSIDFCRICWYCLLDFKLAEDDTPVEIVVWCAVDLEFVPCPPPEERFC